MFIDISKSIYPGMAVYPGDPEVKLKRHFDLAVGDSFSVSELSLSLHAGTHLDAPAHMVRGGLSVDLLPLESTCCLAHVVDTGAASRVEKAHLEGLRVGPGEAVLFRTGNQLLSDELDPEAWVYISQEAAQYCVELACCLVGIDFRDVEPPDSHGEYAVHTLLLGAGILILENLDLRAVAPGKYRLYCFPLKIEGAEASPCRAVLETIPRV